MFIYNPQTTNKARYLNDYQIDEQQQREEYIPKRCINYPTKKCYRKDPVSGVQIALLMHGTNTWICQNCKNKEKIDRWFTNLQQTEIPSVLQQFHNLKGRLVYDINDKENGNRTFGPRNDDPCWQFYSIIFE